MAPIAIRARTQDGGKRAMVLEILSTDMLKALIYNL
jgi:hypothetical protein